jgi:microcin C transport system substrate-binding protein
LLEEAGWTVRNGVLVSRESARPFELEILLGKPWLERIMLPYARNLERLGIKARIRTVDSAQYENRIGSFDFDAIVYRWGQSRSPGNEQAIYWGSAAADSPGSRNYAGIRNAAVDALIEHLAGARNRADLVAAARALDRVLLWAQYVVPLFHSKVDRIAYWNHLEHPDPVLAHGVQLDTWWAINP